MSRLNLLWWISCSVLGLCTSTARSADTFQFRHEHVLGTSCEIQVWTTTRQQAEQVETTVLREVDRLQHVFSSYEPQSELMRWQRGEINGSQLSTDLITVLQRAEFWRLQSDGAFDVRTGEFVKLWKQAAAEQRPPDRSLLESIGNSLRTSPYRIQDSQLAQKQDRLAITLDAIAKGYILDAACARSQREHAFLASPGSGLSVMIGGDMRMIGSASQKVSIANPFEAGEGSQPIESVQLGHSIALATSGGYRRYHEINGVRHSHIIDPRTGESASAVAAVTVIAPGGMDADAAATAVSVLGPSDGMKLVDSLDGFAAMIVLNSGEVISSARWSNYKTKDTNSRPLYVSLLTNADDKDKPGLFVKFTLGGTGGGRYHRPYVAVWLEDKDGFPVKTSVLWLQTTGPGPRWHRDLTKWYSNDQLRKLVDEKELIGTISGATRGAGEYETRFDGTDNDGKPLKPGKYVLCLEAAREHGTHQFVREAIEWGDKPIAKKDLKGGTEFSAMSYRFVPGPVEPEKTR